MMGRRLVASPRVAFLLPLLVTLGSSVAGAQAGSSPWEAWIGCWDQIPRTASTEPPARVCVIPAGQASVVDLVTVFGDSITSRQRLTARGEKREITREGCTGWEHIQATGVRVYLRTMLTCDGIPRLTNSVMAMSRDAEWLDVQGVAVGKSAGVRAARYRETYPDTKLPTAVSAALQGRPRALSAARIAASGAISANDVVEASRYLEVGVLQTWLAERRQGFFLNAQQLVALEEAGVAPSVIDVMVALTYPTVFALDRTRLGDPPPDVLGEERIVNEGPFVDDFGYGYGPYDYGNRPGYGWFPGQQPVIVVRQPSSGEGEEEGGKVVKGRGYVSDRGDSGRSGGDRSGGSTAKGGSSGGSSGTDKGSSTGRKAKPKPSG